MSSLSSTVISKYIDGVIEVALNVIMLDTKYDGDELVNGLTNMVSLPESMTVFRSFDHGVTSAVFTRFLQSKPYCLHC